MGTITRLIWSVVLVLINSITQGFRFLRSSSTSRSALVAENLFLRKQLAFYQEHQIRPHRLTAAARFSLLFWSKFFDWRSALVIVKPETLIGWHRQGFKAFLEVEVSTRAATHSCRPPPVDHCNGSGQFDLGTSSHRQ